MSKRAKPPGRLWRVECTIVTYISTDSDQEPSKEQAWRALVNEADNADAENFYPLVSAATRKMIVDDHWQGCLSWPADETTDGMDWRVDDWFPRPRSCGRQ